MGITVIPDLLFVKSESSDSTVGEIVNKGKYYRHPDSALISYPLVVANPLGSIPEKKLNIAIVGGGAAGVAALYELSRLDGAKNITVTLYESDPDNFVHESFFLDLTTRGLRAGRVSAAKSSDGRDGHAVYEIGAMRFPEIAGLVWHYASVLYPADKGVNLFPNPGTVPTECVHGDRVDRYQKDSFLNPDSPTKKVVDLIRKGLFGIEDAGNNTSLFPIGLEDPAKISAKLKGQFTDECELKIINEQWKIFAKENDKYNLESAVRRVIEARHDQLPNIDGIIGDADKINYYVELFGTMGFGTGGFRPLYGTSIVEMMRLLLWSYNNEYMLPVEANVHFLQDLYNKATGKDKENGINGVNGVNGLVDKKFRVIPKLARVSDVAHLDENPEGKHTLVVFYDVGPDGSEDPVPQTGMYDFVILATTPKQTSSMISKVGFNNNDAHRVTLGDHKRPLAPKGYDGLVRPALVLSKGHDAPNSKLYTAINNVHMVSSSKVFATIKKCEFDEHAPEFLCKGKIKAIVSDCGLGSTYVIPSTVIKKGNLGNASDEYYSFLISYTWEDESKGLQHYFGEYPMNKKDDDCPPESKPTEQMMNAVISRTLRYVRDPDNGTGEWWFAKAMSQCTLEDPLSYDWTTHHTSGAFKLDIVGDHQNSDLLFRYHTHVRAPALKNKFFLANDSYSHLGGWVEGAFMSAVNAVCGLIVAANDGDINKLTTEARKVVLSLDSVVEIKSNCQK